MRKRAIERMNLKKVLIKMNKERFIPAITPTYCKNRVSNTQKWPLADAKSHDMFVSYPQPLNVLRSAENNQYINRVANSLFVPLPGK
jgi:hypothetical protein